MHNLDRTFMEFETANEYEGAGEYEQEGTAFEFNGEQEWGEVLGETEVQELAAELLSVSNEQELNQFLGDLIKKAGRAIGSVVKSPIGQALGGVLKTVAKQALPIAGAALGNLIVPGVGGAIGGKLASAAGSMFGLELEGLSGEDREFEVAKAFVRLGADATKQAVEAAQQGTAVQSAVNAAIRNAAQKFAPGLLQEVSAPSIQSAAAAGARLAQAQAAQSAAGPRHVCAGAKHEGRWIRKGHRILLLGL